MQSEIAIIHSTTPFHSLIRGETPESRYFLTNKNTMAVFKLLHFGADIIEEHRSLQPLEYVQQIFLQIYFMVNMEEELLN